MLLGFRCSLVSGARMTWENNMYKSKYAWKNWPQFEASAHARVHPDYDLAFQGNMWVLLPDHKEYWAFHLPRKDVSIEVLYRVITGLHTDYDEKTGQTHLPFLIRIGDQVLCNSGPEYSVGPYASWFLKDKETGSRKVAQGQLYQTLVNLISEAKRNGKRSKKTLHR